MKKTKHKILVCGTGFGRIYIDAINNSEEYQLCGILGRGGKTSKALSVLHDVPYYTSVDEVSSDIDLACVAVPNVGLGGEGSIIAKKFLNKGISTLLEHPVHKNEIIECLEEAKGVNFFVNPFYRFTDTFLKYIDLLNIIWSKSTLLNASLECSINVLYSGLDMLCVALKELDEFHIYESIEFNKKNQSVGQSTTFVNILIGNIPVSLKINRDVDLKNKDNPMHLYHRIELTFDSGRLCLVNTNGPIIWMPFIDMGIDVIEGIDEEDDFPASIVFSDQKSHSMKYSVEKEWVSAARLAIRETINQNEAEKYKYAHFQLYISELWSKISQKIGYANLMEININKNSRQILLSMLDKQINDQKV